MRTRRGAGRGVGLRPRGRDWIWAGAAAGLVLSALRARSRAEALSTLEGWVPGGDAADVPVGLGRFRLVAVEGCEVDGVTAAAAVAHAETRGLDVLEVLPGDLDAEQVLEVLRSVDPSTYRDDRFALGRGANQAVLLSDAVVSRIGDLPEEPVREADLVDLLVEAKRCAPVTSDVVVAPGARSAPERADRRRRALRALYDGMTPVGLAAPFVGFAMLVLGVVLAPVWGVLALVAYCAQPALALAGTAVTGARRRSVARPAVNLARAVAVVAAGDAPGSSGGTTSDADDADAADADARAAYAATLDRGLDHLFEERRTTCPWCGSSDLAEHVVATDVLQAKPGTFVLDRCGSCGHVFQNPRLSLDGLDFYYGDFYDGAGGAHMEFVFQASAKPYLGRAELVAAHTEGAPPERWLDVGAGHAHFCLIAGDTFPTTRFEALDLNAAIEVAERRGWVAASHRGLFPELADQLSEDVDGGYDVVSMHHYLEHTREPNDELKAARRVLRPGGHLLIEVPDPECVFGTLLGRWWIPWFQPQHQHLIPVGNLCEALEAEGFTVVATERAEAHQPVETSMGTWLFLNHLGPPVGSPWQEPATRAATARRIAVFAAGAPVIAAGLALDTLVGPLLGRLPKGSNTYRVLARLD